ncbi:hypothetical protein CJ030_MR1G022626 [Morella rubra]|uniref:Uncharacterized protein n=1 Tax=Morella rubra TaxID=262757 RepID=A0A6A1WRD3_9ROSI|nr:hypothetical protein CJ030_MR1G022626 [Morella rubra]
MNSISRRRANLECDPIAHPGGAKGLDEFLASKNVSRFLVMQAASQSATALVFESIIGGCNVKIIIIEGAKC